MDQRILIVDDSPTNVEILRELLYDHYELETAASGEECLQKLLTFSPDLVLLDVMMPGIDGYETCRRIKQSPCGNFTQVILVTGKATMSERLQGYEVGADDYVVKPFDHDEFLAKVRVQFRMRDILTDLWKANAQVQEFNAELEQLVMRRSKEIVATRDVAVFALAKLAESRDPETGEHLERMREYCVILAEHLGREGPYTEQIDHEFLADLYRSSPLHDIGKVGIPDAILLKPGRLTIEEFQIMKQHSAIGAHALAEAAQHSDSGSFLKMAIEIARHHHERFNGSGYPDGLTGQDIPLCARIVAVADVFDALTTQRVYKRPVEPLVAKAMIENESDKHFDPAIVAAFLARFDDFLKVHEASGHRPRELAGTLAAAETRG